MSHMHVQQNILPSMYEEEAAFGEASQRLDLVWQPPVKPHWLNRINKQVFCVQLLQQRAAVSASYSQPLQSMKDILFCNSNLRVTNYGSGNQHQHETLNNSAVKNFITIYTFHIRKSIRLMTSAVHEEFAETLNDSSKKYSLSQLPYKLTSSEENQIYLEHAVRKKPSKRLVQNSSTANSSPSSVRLPVSRCRNISLKAKSLNVSTTQHKKTEAETCKYVPNPDYTAEIPAEIFLKTFPYWLLQRVAQGGGCDLPPQEHRAEKNMKKTHVSIKTEITQSSLMLPELWDPLPYFSTVLCSWPQPPPCTPQTR